MASFLEKDLELQNPAGAVDFHSRRYCTKDDKEKCDILPRFDMRNNVQYSDLLCLSRSG